MRIVAIFAALLAVAFASPNLEARQQGESCDVCIIVDRQPSAKDIWHIDSSSTEPPASPSKYFWAVGDRLEVLISIGAWSSVVLPPGMSGSAAYVIFTLRYYCCERAFLTAAETLLLNVFRGVKGAKDPRLMNSPSKSTLVYMAMNISR